MARILIGIILLWGGLVIWMKENTEPLPYRDYQNIQFLLAVSRPAPDPNTSINEQMQQAQTLDFMLLNEPIKAIPAEIQYFINLKELLYIKPESIAWGWSFLQSLKNLQHIASCSDSKADIKVKNRMGYDFVWGTYSESQVARLQQYLPSLQSANYCAYRILFG